jgi:hypothetical protein
MPTQAATLVEIGGGDATSWPYRVVRYMFAGEAAHECNWSGLTSYTCKAKKQTRHKLKDTALGDLILG